MPIAPKYDYAALRKEHARRQNLAAMARDRGITREAMRQAMVRAHAAKGKRK